MRSGYCLVIAVLLGLAVGCGSGGGGDAPPAADRFAFVILADPHVYGEGDAADRLRAAVDWIDAHRGADGIEVVFVAGDHGNAAQAKAILDALDVPWVPVIGDNVIQGGGEASFDDVMGPHYEALTSSFPSFRRAATPVADGVGGVLWLQNLSFEHGGVHFLGLDWCTRTVGGDAGEQADLHDVAGGTLPFLAAELEACETSRRENIVMVTHHPMHDVLAGAGAFSPSELAAIEAVTAPYAEHVFANFAGHYHFEWHDAENAGGFEVFVSDAVWDDDATLRLVRVLDDGTRLRYEQEVVTVVAAP